MWPTKPTITTLRTLPRRAWRGFLLPALALMPVVLGVTGLCLLIAPEDHPFYGTYVLMADYHNEEAVGSGEEPVEIKGLSDGDRLVVVMACAMLLVAGAWWCDQLRYGGRE